MSHFEKVEMIIKGIHRNAGFIDYDRMAYFTKRIYKNIMRSYHGFGISTFILGYLNVRGIKDIYILYESNEYHTNLMTYFINGFVRLDGNDKQLILPMNYFDIAPKQERWQERKAEPIIFTGEFSKPDIKPNNQKFKIFKGNMLLNNFKGGQDG